MMARWITVKAPFDYRWPEARAITAFREEHVGEHFVKDDIADYAVKRGFAKEGRAKDSTARSSKSGPRAARVARAKQATADIAAHVTPAERRARAPSTRRTTKAASAGNKAIDAVAANLQPDAPVVRADHSDDGGAAVGRAVDPSAGKR